jgi:hypothetical protein
MSFADKMKQQEQQAQEAGHASKGGDWFKFVEGDNIFRVLTEPEMIFEKYNVGVCYTDCGYEGSPKFMTYVLQTEKNVEGEDELVIKLAKLPYKIGTQIAEYESDEDYSFTGFPMPFNIKVKAKGAGTKEVEYTVIPSPNRSEVSDEIKAQLAKLKPVPELIEKMKANQKEKHVADGTWQKEQDRKEALKAGLAKAKADAGVKDPVVQTDGSTSDYPEEEINPEDIPF